LDLSYLLFFYSGRRVYKAHQTLPLTPLLANKNERPINGNVMSNESILKNISALLMDECLG